MKLYEPIKIRNVTFPSRIVMAPMCPFGVEAGEDESLGEEILAYYERRLQGKLGLLITQCFNVLSKDVGLRSFGLSKKKQRDDLKRLAEISHERGVKIIAQIAYPSGGHHRHDTIDFWKKEELEEIENLFVEAARVVKEAGCDGVELHGANMFFLNLFSSPITNHRIDEYGGDVKGRLHLAGNIIRRIKEFADENFIVSYRMGWNKDLETDVETAKELESLGIDILHISYGIRESDRYMPKDYPPVVCFPGTTRERQISPEDFLYNDVVYTGKILHRELRIPVILVDEIWTFERGEELLQKDAGDFIAYGRPFLAEPNFVSESEKDPSFDKCYRCPACAWFDDCKRCPKVKQREFI